jgi:hypothetical protein
MAKMYGNSASADKRRARIGRQVRDIVNEVVIATVDEDVEVAIDRLHSRVQLVSGTSFDRAWAKRVVETMRRGDVFTVIVK